MPWHPPHQTFHYAPRRVAQQDIDGTDGSIGADGRDLSQLLQIRHQRSVRAHCKTHAGNENSVEEALQDRREALVPNWINQDQRFCGQKLIGVGVDVRAVEL
jgi:hypothetical protein